MVVGVVRGDEIILRTGKSLVGRIVEQTPEYIKITTASGELKIRRELIKEIQYPEQLLVEELEGDAAMEEGKLEEALRYYEEGLRRAGSEGKETEELEKKVEKVRKLIKERVLAEFQTRLKRAETLIEEEKFEEAELLLRTVKQEVPAGGSQEIIDELLARLYTHKAQYFLNIIDVPSAEAALGKAIEFNANLAEAHLLLADIISRDPSRVDMAIAEYELAFKLGQEQLPKSKLGQVAYVLGSLYQQQSQLENAIRYYGQCYELMPEEYQQCREKIAQIYLQLAMASSEQREACLQKALEFQPYYTEALVALGRCLMQRGKYEEAIERLNRAVSVNPALAEAHYLLSECYREIKNFDAELDELKKVLSIEPDNYQALCAMGEYYLRGGKYAEALEYLKRAQQLEPERSRAYLGLGKAQRRSGQLESALESLKKALDFNARNYEAVFELASIHKDQKNYEQALALFDNVITVLSGVVEPSPEEVEMLAESYNSRGEVQLSLGNAFTAITNFQFALGLFPQNPRSYYLLAQAYTKLQRYQEAERNLNHAIQLAPDAPEYYLSLGILYQNFMDHDSPEALGRAREYYMKYIQLEGPDKATVQDWLREIDIILGQGAP